MVDGKAEQQVLDYDELARRVRSDAAALGLLYQKYYDLIFSFCVHRLFCRDTAQDVTGSVFLAVARNIDQFKGRCERDFCNWVYSIAANHTNQHLRRHFRQQRLLQAKAQDMAAQEPDRNKDWSSIYQAIVTLKPIQQTIITLRFFDGLSHEQIAEILGKSPSAVRVALHRGLKKLKQQLNAVSVEELSDE